MGLFGKSDAEKEREDIARADEARRKLDEARKHQAERVAQAAPSTTPGAATARPQTSPGAVPVSQPVSQPAADEVYTVAKGDNLSKIAKHHLGNANDWRTIYEANRDVIGDNPDLIKPGQRLRIPHGASRPRST